MTVICSFQIEGYPVLFGDLVTSVQSDIGPRRLPFVSTEDVDYQDNWRVFGLKQKISIINDKLVIAWTGSVSAARDAIRGLKKHLEDLGETTPESVGYYLENHEVNNRHKVSFIALLRDEHGLGVISMGTAMRWDDESFGKVIVAGSGQDHVRGIFQSGSLGTAKASYEGNDPSSVASGYALQIATNLLLEEWAHKSTLAACFGGGYEVVSYWDGRMRKEGGSTVLIYTCDVKEVERSIEINLVGPRIAVKQQYFENNLFIRAVEWSQVKDEIIILFDEIFGPVCPVEDEEPTEQADKPTKLEMSLDSNIVCYGVHVATGNKHLFNATAVEQIFIEGSTSSVHFNCDELGNLIAFETDKDVEVRLSELVHQGFKDRCPPSMVDLGSGSASKTGGPI